MCDGTAMGEGKEIKISDIHPRSWGLYTKNIYVDSCIYEEISNLLKNGIATIGHSCCGHGKSRSQAFIFDVSIGDALDFGYDVYKFRHEIWEPERYENLILLNSGSTDKPISYGKFEVHPIKR